MKPVEELTDAERVSVLLSAGVKPDRIVREDDKVRFIFPPSEIQIVDGQYRVTIDGRERQ